MEKITMLGVSNSGKTCFIYAMYDFMQRVRNGFSFLTNDADVDLELNEGWKCIAYDGNWPEGTQVTSFYDFNVLFKSQAIMEFSWCDFRGGTIMEKATEEDVKELHKRIFESSCLIICIGADTIKEIISGNSMEGRELNRLNSLITRYALQNKKRIPIIFALTKADLYTKNEQGQLLSIIKEYFSILYEVGSGWTHAIVPVSLGTFQDSIDNKINGMVAPKNIHIPVMFFLRSILAEKINGIQERLVKIKSKRVQYQSNLSISKKKNWWEMVWNGDNRKYLEGLLSQLSEEEKNITNQLSELEKAMESMGDMFKVCKVFNEGIPVNL